MKILDNLDWVGYWMMVIAVVIATKLSHPIAGLLLAMPGAGLFFFGSWLFKRRLRS